MTGYLASSQEEVGVLMRGIGLGESPRWHEERLWFADWVAQKVMSVDLDGRGEVIANVGSLPFSIDWLPEGPMLITSGRQVVRLEPDGSLVEHVDLSDLSDYAWNEIVVDGRGNTYVNNIGFDMTGGAEFATGIIALLTPDGSTHQVADELAFPNGMAVTADNSTLIVAESYGRRLTAFDIAADGRLSGRRAWAELGDGAPDGICIDTDAAVWYADVPNKRCVRVHEGGQVLQAIDLDRGCFACMLGGPDGRTLFMLANEWSGPESVGRRQPAGRVLTAQAPAPHSGWP
jgi:sugar lactone lactonase YvrE